MMAWWKWPLRFALVAALAIALEVAQPIAFPFGPFYDGPLEYSLKYLNFSTLSKALDSRDRSLHSGHSRR